jgi:hypothetical protein
MMWALPPQQFAVVLVEDDDPPPSRMVRPRPDLHPVTAWGR